ncbi:SPOR domain-containing protein [bacterium]|nr:SPOR domain-containing protein [bacterium]
MKYFNMTLVCVVSILVLSCSGSSKIQQKQVVPVKNDQIVKDKQESGEKKQDESFNPYSLDDRWRIKPKQKDLSIQPYSEMSQPNFGNDHKESSAMGYRIQIFTTKDYYEAIAQRDEAIKKFTEEVYLDFEQPYYKVRIGNFTDKTAADEIKEFAKSVGYLDAWVIQTRVIISGQ